MKKENKLGELTKNRGGKERIKEIIFIHNIAVKLYKKIAKFDRFYQSIIVGHQLKQILMRFQSYR